MDKEYIASEYRRMHKVNKFAGGSLEMHLPEIRKLIKEHDCKTLLDYGCGGATFHKERLLPATTLYDPYREPYTKEPTGTFDIVICTDVMEHIPIDEVGKTLARLMELTDKVLFLAISTKPAGKKFANGENVHVTVRAPHWWDIMLSCAKNIKIIRHYS